MRQMTPDERVFFDAGVKTVLVLMWVATAICLLVMGAFALWLKYKHA